VHRQSAIWGQLAGFSGQAGSGISAARSAASCPDAKGGAPNMTNPRPRPEILTINPYIGGES